MKQKIVAILLLLSSLLVLCLPCSANDIPSCSAQAYCLMCDDGTVIASSNADARLPMASTTKIMTAIVAIENLDEDKVVEISPKAAATEGSSAYLIEGEKLSVRELLFALMLSSANDAAQALCESVEGGEEAFLLLMNEKAARLGLYDTHFDNPHGLDSEDHYTTARELSIICAYALENERFCELCSCESHVCQSEEGLTRVFVNHNRLLFSYEGCIGVKTGYTVRDGRCLVSAATREGLTLICVTLNDRSDWADHRALLDYGFDNYEYYSALRENALLRSVPVKNGERFFVSCKNADDLSLCLPKGAHTAAYRYLFLALEAPIYEGDLAGSVEVYVDGRLSCTVDMIAAEDIKVQEKGIKAFFARLFDKIGAIFR